jgi:hypothetical protein
MGSDARSGWSYWTLQRREIAEDVEQVAAIPQGVDQRCPGLRTIRENGEQPGLDRRPSLEATDPGYDGQPGFLDDLFRDTGVRHEGLGQSHQGSAVKVDQPGERRFVAAAQSVDQLGFRRPSRGFYGRRFQHPSRQRRALEGS